MTFSPSKARVLAKLMLTPAQETNSFYKLFKNSVKPYHEAWKGEESKNDIARSVLTALSERNPTGRFLKKVVGDNDKYVIMQKPSVWNKIIKALERNAPQVKLPSKRKRRTSKRMLESCMVEIPPPNTTKQKKRRGRSRPKQVLPSSTTGSSSVESAAVQADPYDLGKLAKRFMHYAFAWTGKEFILQQAANDLHIPVERLVDVIDILEGAGVLELDSADSSIGCLTPCVGSPQEFRASFEEEEKFLDTWISALKTESSDANGHKHIVSKQVASLFQHSSKGLVLHVPLGCQMESVSQNGRSTLKLTPASPSMISSSFQGIILSPRFSPSTDDRIYIRNEEITNHDVICGNRNTIHMHPGNMILLELAKKAAVTYGTSNNAEKRQVKNDILDQVKGRFLMPCCDGRCYLLTEKDAGQKVKELIRKLASGASKPTPHDPRPSSGSEPPLVLSASIKQQHIRTFGPPVANEAMMVSVLSTTPSQTVLLENENVPFWSVLDMHSSKQTPAGKNDDTMPALPLPTMTQMELIETSADGNDDEQQVQGKCNDPKPSLECPLSESEAMTSTGSSSRSTPTLE